MKPGLWEVYVATVNQGLPNKLISVGRGAGQAGGRPAEGEVGYGASGRPRIGRPGVGGHSEVRMPPLLLSDSSCHAECPCRPI